MTQVIEIAARSVGERPRRGEILETLGDPGAPHYRVLWDDGHESVVYPHAGTRIKTEEHLPARDPVPRLAAVLRAAGVAFELIPHRPTKSAVAEAEALGVRPEAIGKTVVVRAETQRIRVVVPASRRLDLRKVAAVTGTRSVLLTETELAEEFPDYDVGAVPPFGGDDRVLLDEALASEPSLIVEAGSHEFSIRLAPRDLIVVAKAQVADVAA